MRIKGIEEVIKWMKVFVLFITPHVTILYNKVNIYHAYLLHIETMLWVYLMVLKPVCKYKVETHIVVFSLKLNRLRIESWGEVWFSVTDTTDRKNIMSVRSQCYSESPTKPIPLKEILQNTPENNDNKKTKYE